MIRRHDLYVFNRWLRAFLMTLAVISVLLLMERMYDDLWNLVTYQASLREMALYFIWFMPRWIPTLLPATVLISALLVLIQMHSKREIVALRAAGLSVLSITRSLWLAGALCAGGVFVLNGWVIPQSVDSARLLLRNLEFRAAEARGENPTQIGNEPQLAFANERAGRLWYFDQFNTRAYTAYNAHLYQLDAQGNLISHTEAREAYYDDISQSWIFLDGTTLHYGSADGDRMRVDAFERWEPAGLSEDPEMMLALSKRPKDLSFDSLRKLLDTEELVGSPALSPYRARMHQVWVSPVMSLVVIGMAIPFALRGVRTNPMVGVSQALFAFFFYYLLINAFTILGAREVMSAAASAWAPHALMGFVALLLNLRRD